VLAFWKESLGRTELVSKKKKNPAMGKKRRHWEKMQAEAMRPLSRPLQTPGTRPCGQRPPPTRPLRGRLQPRWRE